MNSQDPGEGAVEFPFHDLLHFEFESAHPNRWLGQMNTSLAEMFGNKDDGLVP
jgi:hypothetical protein